MAKSEGSRKAKTGTPLPEVPDKLHFRIGEVARLLDLPAYVLRFWESEFPQLKPGKGDTGQRLYRRRDLDTLLVIRRLLYEQGYTIPGARQLLEERSRPAAEHAVAVDVQTAHDTQPGGDNSPMTLGRLRTELRELADLLARPVAILQSNPVHRDLLPATKKRGHQHFFPTLFASRRELPGEDPTE